MNPPTTTLFSGEGVKTQTTGWGFEFIPDFASLWGKYRTSCVDEFEMLDGFDVVFPSKPEVAPESDAIDVPGPGREENSVNNQVNSCHHGILEVNANLKGKRDKKNKEQKGKMASKQNEPTRRSMRLVQNVPKIVGTGQDESKADPVVTRFEKKKAYVGHHSKKLKDESPQAPDNIKCEAFSQPHVFLKQSVNANHHLWDSTPKTFNCQKCTKTCASKHHLQAHLVSKHNPSPLLCMFCGKLLGTKASLKKHQAYQEACRKVQQAFSQERKK